ncbi:MAG: NAD(P)-dependent oxidoreductase [Paludibacteraceae bacterium]|nr:NAD(P)-dependent oxidoreductase [Paludibacteraceae bacterium]
MKILVTGFSGFIGTYLVEKLKQYNHELILLDISNGVDICDWKQIKQYNNIDVIIHLANLSFVPASYSDPQNFYTTNYLSTLNMLELCRKNNARLIFFSSYVYGQPQYQPIDEVHPIQAFNPYAQTKVICESLCEGYFRDFGVPITIFRPFNIYGIGQHPDFLIPTIIQQAMNGKIEIKDDRPRRDYIHVSDIVEAVISAVEKPSSEKHIYNLGSGVSYSVKEIVTFVRSFFDNDIDYICKNEYRPNEVMDTVANINKIKCELNWQPKVTIEKGIQKMIISK